MKKLLLVLLLLTGCATKHPLVVNVPVKVIKTETPRGTGPDIYLMCAGRLFKGVIVSVNGSEAVYKCPVPE